MKLEKGHINIKLLIAIAILIPVMIITAIIIVRNIVTPTNEEILDELKNTKFYTTEVKYKFMNSKSEFEENTKQYYSCNDGIRIEFETGLERVKVYKGSEIRVEENDEEVFTLDKRIDIIYPLAFLENIFSNFNEDNIEVVKSEWGDSEYLKINIKYCYKNKHLDRGELYVDKTTKSPVALRIFDTDGKERILITYENFKREKQLDGGMF